MASFGSEFARQVVKYPIANKKRVAGKDPFWDKKPAGPNFSELNNITPPSAMAIQQYQLSKLEALSEIAINQQVQTHGQAAAEINQIFANSQINSAGALMEQEDEQTLDEILTRWMNMLNGMYAHQGKESYTEQEYNIVQNKLKNITTMLTNIINILKANNNVILSSYLIELQALMKEVNFTPANITNWVKHLTHLKGDTVEQIGKEWIAQHKIPNVSTLEPIVTGAVEYRGSKSTHKGQLIQDLMVIAVDDPDLLNAVKISFKVTGSNKQETMSLGDFIKHLNSLSGSAKHIHLTDEGYENLMKYSALNIQAKAGINQNPWNQKTAKVSIADFADEHDSAMVMSSLKVFELLKGLNNLDPAENYWELKDTAAAYQAIANYGLATAMAKVLHLSDNDGNQYLLTPSGFITFPERLRQLFKLEKQKAQIKGYINLKDKLSTPHEVVINKG